MKNHGQKFLIFFLFLTLALIFAQFFGIIGYEAPLPSANADPRGYGIFHTFMEKLGSPLETPQWSFHLDGTQDSLIIDTRLGVGEMEMVLEAVEKGARVLFFGPQRWTQGPMKWNNSGKSLSLQGWVDDSGQKKDFLSSLPLGNSMEKQDGMEVILENEEGIFGARYYIGKGMLQILSVRDFLTNESFLDFEKARFFFSLLPDPLPSHWLIKIRNFNEVQHLNQPIRLFFQGPFLPFSLSALVLLLLLFTYSLTRFGKPTVPFDPQYRAIREHLQALGQFWWSQKALFMGEEINTEHFLQHLKHFSPPPSDQQEKLVPFLHKLLEKTPGSSGLIGRLSLLNQPVKDFGHLKEKVLLRKRILETLIGYKKGAT